MEKHGRNPVLFLFGGMLLKVIKADLGDNKEVQILALADWHNGDKRSDGKKILQYLDYLRTTPNAYAILNGDLMNTAIRTSLSDVYSETLSPMDQIQHCVKLFDGLQDKIIAINPGNHELRVWKNDGLDMTLVMATQLGIAEKYSPESSLVFVSFGKWSSHRHSEKVTYSIYCVHGDGGGRTEGAKVNRLMQLAAICDADIYIHSHTHTPAIVKQQFYRVHAGNKSVRLVDKLFVNTGATLEYGGYAELKSFKPASTDTPIIHLDGTRRRMSATL